MQHTDPSAFGTQNTSLPSALRFMSPSRIIFDVETQILPVDCFRNVLQNRNFGQNFLLGPWVRFGFPEQK